MLVFIVVPAMVLALPAVLVAGPVGVAPAVAALLALSGVGNTLARVLVFAGVARLGASSSGALQGTYPFFAFALALLFLGESITLLRGIATALIGGGVAVVALSQPQPSGHTPGAHRRIALALPLLAALCFAIGDALARSALREAPYPLFGAGVGYVAGALTLVAAFAAVPRLRKQLVLTDRGLGWFVLSGLIQSFAILTFYLALSDGEVVRIAPMIGTGPLFVLLWSFVLLRRFEIVQRTTVAGTVMVVAGAALLVCRLSP
jgi:drug/metabolite transporter (DMT)-like permease